MTISTTTRKNSYSGNGSTAGFAYTFKITDQAHVKVYIRNAAGTETLKTISTHYTVSGVGAAGGGTVTFTSGNIPASGETVLLFRETPKNQGFDYVENDPFPAQSHEDGLDKLTAITQEIQEELDRTIKASKTNTISTVEFTTSAADRANKLFAFDGSGDIDVTQEIGTFTGNWAASTAYAVRDLIKDTSNNNIYICVTAHTSSGSQPISSNTDAAKWSLIVDAASATTSAAAAVVSAQLADDYAVKVSGAVTGSDYSAKAHAVGGTGVTDATGAAKEWAEEAEDNTVAGAGTYSAKHHATKGAASATAAASSQSTASTAATTATNYATKVDGAITGSDFSSKAWSVGGTNVTSTASRGAAKEWATTTGAAVDTSEYSAKEYAIGTTVAIGSAKDWAVLAEDSAVTGSSYSALHHAAKAAASATSAAASSAASSAAGLTYTYSTTTTDSDPGTGVIRFNNGTLASATAAYMDDADANSVDVSTYLLTWDDSTTTIRGTFKMVKSGTPSTYALYNITGASTDASGYVKFALTHVASNGTFSNSDTVIVHHTRTGNTGSFSSGAVDLNGEKLTLDANANTSIHASTDDQIDIEIAGADDFRFTANTFSALAGSTIAAQALTATSLSLTGGLTATPAADGHAVFNEGSVDADFRVESDGNENMLFVDGGNNRVGIGAVPDTLFHTYTSSNDGILKHQATGGNAIIDIYGNRTGDADIGHLRFQNAANGALAQVRVERSGADNTGKMKLQVSSAGSMTDLLTLDVADVTVPTGNLVFGTGSKGVYLGVTSATAANLLNDYEEGTFTATLTGSSANPTSGVKTTTGVYRKIGSLVTIDIYYSNVDLSGASGNVIVTGIPFAFEARVNIPPAFKNQTNCSGNYNTWYGTADGTQLDEYYTHNQGTFTNESIRSAATQYYLISGTYRTAS